MDLSVARLHVFPSDLGWMALLESDSGVERLVFGYRSPQQARTACLADYAGEVADAAAEAPLVARLQKYASGEPDDFSDVPLQLGRAGFTQKVLANCRRVPQGQTRTYQQIAAQSGSPRAARAVGNIMANNRFPLLIPCHRVVGSGGSPGGYSGPGGLALKRRLLGLEGVEV